MTVYLYITAWILLIAIPITSSLFCFVDYHIHSQLSIDNYIAAILFTVSIIPLIITHISRFALLRIQHGISNATMAFNLGEITWHQYLDKFEIILQEDYNITNPSVLRKYSIYLSTLLVLISVIIILLTHPFFYIWINAIWLGIASIFTAIIVWTKSDNFNVKDLSNRFKLDSYSILKEMHHIAIILLIQFVIYLCISALFPYIYSTYIIDQMAHINTNQKDIQCDGTVATHFVLTIGLTITWIIQLKYSLRALFEVHKAVPLTQLLSSYDGYKAFLRFLVSELSIENLEFFQLSMRWRYRICCWLYGVQNGTKQPAQHINLPFKIFSFEYVDRLLPQQHGGGLVPNTDEKQQNGLAFVSRDSEMFFTTLPMSRKASVNSHFTSPYASNKDSRTTTPRFGAMALNAMNMSAGALVHTAPSSLHYALPPTILEGNDEEEMELTRTATTTYVLQAQTSFDCDDAINEPEYSQSLILNKSNMNDSMKNMHVHKLDIHGMHHNMNHHASNTMIIKKQKLKNNNSTPTKKGSPRSRPALSPLTMTAPVSSAENTENYHRLIKIPREDEMIDGIVNVNDTPHTMIIQHTPPAPIAHSHAESNSVASSLLPHTNTNTNASPEISLNLNDITTEQSDIVINKKKKFIPPFIATDTNTNTNTNSVEHDNDHDENSNHIMDRIELTNETTDLSQHLTPVQSKPAPGPLNFKAMVLDLQAKNNNNTTDMETPNTPEPNVLNMPDTELHDHDKKQQLLLGMDKSEDDENEDGMEYIDYHQYESPKEVNNNNNHNHHSKTDVTVTVTVLNNDESNKLRKKRTPRSVRFASSVGTDKDNNSHRNILGNKLKDIAIVNVNDHDGNGNSENMNMNMNNNHISTPPLIQKPQISMHDLLGGHMGVGAGANININVNNDNNNNNNNTSDTNILPLEQQITQTETFNGNYNMNSIHKQVTRDESVVSKAAEPSWFAAWFRKGNIAGGQQERADTLLQYSDLSWRRLKKVTREVNMSAIARGSVDALFKKYTRSLYLESKAITLEEYDESMRDAWVSCWENMNDSLRRFAKSGHYEQYLASIGQLTIRRVSDEQFNQNNQNNNANEKVDDHDMNGDVNDMNNYNNNNNPSTSNNGLKFRIRGKSKTDHSRAPAVVIT